MKTIAPQHLTDAMVEPVEDQLNKIFYEVIFKPLVEALADYTHHDDFDELENSPTDPLREALRLGRVHYADGIFYGDLNAAVSKALRVLGARFDKRSGRYEMADARVPAWVKAASEGFMRQAKTAHDLIFKTLGKTMQNLDERLKGLHVDPTETLDRMESGFERLARGISVMPELSHHSREELARAYSNNMDLWIKNWSVESITKLRQAVEKNAVSGYRFAGLAEEIKHQYGVSQSKAKFLARQETSLFMSEFRKERFTEAGVSQYMWSTSHDSRVRHDHNYLDGRKFSYTDPPVVDKATGRRGNPGTDFNCRCVDVPLVGTHLMEKYGKQ